MVERLQLCMLVKHRGEGEIQLLSKGNYHGAICQTLFHSCPVCLFLMQLRAWQPCQITAIYPHCSGEQFLNDYDIVCNCELRPIIINVLLPSSAYSFSLAPPPTHIMCKSNSKIKNTLAFLKRIDAMKKSS